MPPPPPTGSPGFGAPAPAAVGYGAPGYGAPAPAAAGLSPHTNVMGRRIVAYIIDSIIATVIAVVVFLAVADTATVPFSGVCDLIDGGLCFEAGDRVWLAEGGNAALVYLVGIGYWLFANIVIQGIVGGTPGKLVVGLRVVSAQTGQKAGMGKCAIRTVLWVVDSIPYFLPLVGLITALVSKSRQRVGDLVAKTFVVPRNAVGLGGTAAAAAPMAAYGTPHSTGYQQPAPQQPAPQPMAFQQPVAERPVEQVPAETAPAETAQTTSAAAAGEPQWDAARNAWIMWDASRSSWMIHDTATGQWRPM